jgi:Gpi18-like mannosyltransferase
MVLFSIALAFKTQAVFFAPFLLVLYLKKAIPLWTLVLPPAIYFLTVIPAWIAGRPLMDLLTMHLQQVETFRQLTMNAPNFYQWLPEDYYLFGRFGIVLAASAVFVYAMLVWKSEVQLDAELLVRLALTSALILPFFLPRMHERYFFVADVLAIVYAFYSPKHFYVPVIVGLASLFSYFPFLFGKTVLGLPYLAMFMAAMIVIVVLDTIRFLYPSFAEAKTAS